MEFFFNNLISFIIGICIGSFLNVVIYRLPKGISIITPRSSCPKCNQRILWTENIPIISWIVLRGKCKYCSTKISFRYPLIEILTALLFTVFSYSSPHIYQSLSNNFICNLFGWFFLSILIIITFIDLDHFWIPQSLLNFGLLFGILNLFFVKNLNLDNSAVFTSYLISSISSFFMFEVIRYFSRIFYKKDALGKGDSKLIGVIALWLGPVGVLLSISITYFFAAIYLLIGIKLKYIDRKEFVPFAPFLSFGALTVWFFGNEFLIENFYRF